MNKTRNEGEGSRTHDRNYREGVQQHLKKGHVDQEAKDAEKALEGPEGKELKRAEKLGREGKPSPLGEGRRAKPAG